MCECSRVCFHAFCVGDDDDDVMLCGLARRAAVYSSERESCWSISSVECGECRINRIDDKMCSVCLCVRCVCCGECVPVRCLRHLEHLECRL